MRVRTTEGRLCYLKQRMTTPSDYSTKRFRKTLRYVFKNNRSMLINLIRNVIGNEIWPNYNSKFFMNCYLCHQHNVLKDHPEFFGFLESIFYDKVFLWTCVDLHAIFDDDGNDAGFSRSPFWFFIDLDKSVFFQECLKNEDVTLELFINFPSLFLLKPLLKEETILQELSVTICLNEDVLWNLFTNENFSEYLSIDHFHQLIPENSTRPKFQYFLSLAKKHQINSLSEFFPRVLAKLIVCFCV